MRGEERERTHLLVDSLLDLLDVVLDPFELFGVRTLTLGNPNEQRVSGLLAPSTIPQSIPSLK